ncbi:MAG: thioredoxin domain-containing protein [Deltaproteobacteria bacterium]|nr:thioredoxin domain-containing protein [Deltaproteobacteria bacterium]TLN03758.1 MAG: thioredoxin domain-containing protein [bacterium]
MTSEYDKNIAENDRMYRLANVDTENLPEDGGPDFNRLIFSQSPYLLQHAENPVDWYPWGDEAFTKAKSEDKPVFLSIGYATCHWCHVMERESFEDDEVAVVLNEKFVCIKVDREERPDIDDQYMTVAQLLTGGGGWPLTIIMTADKEPFFAATYLPKTPKQQLPGIIEVLDKIDEFWNTNRDAVLDNCSQVLQGLKKAVEPHAGVLEDEAVMAKAFQVLISAFDNTWAGFGVAPKFPLPHYLSFLIRFWKKSRAVNALWMTEDTLKMIRRGGIFDQLGFGIHRYSVDKQWLVPHFEKMLYDQAMMVHACLDAYQATGDSQYRATAGEIASFVLKEMRSSEGGFYSAWDADTDGVEGEYYTWTRQEIFSVLDSDAAEMACRLFDISEQGNFEGRNILHLPVPVQEFADKEGIPLENMQQKIENWRIALETARKERKKPLRDEKILSAWNGLMISALAKCFAVTGESLYREASETALRFITNQLRNAEGRLLRSWYRGKASIHGFLEDYAFIGWALIQMYEATLERQYLDAARKNCKEVLKLFADDEQYGLFDSGSDSKDLLVRKKGGHDGVIPSGNAVAAMNLIRLGKITADSRLLEEGKGILRSFMGSIDGNPITGLHFLSALDYLSCPETEVTFSGRIDTATAREMLLSVHKRLIPGLVLRVSEENAIVLPKGNKAETVVQICASGTCRLPVTETAELERLLDEIA